MTDLFLRYYRDISNHLPDVSGFRLAPSNTGSGPYAAAYLQAYTTDKSVTYNQDGRHHAKYLTAVEALGPTQPGNTIEDLYTIYEGAKKHNPSKARLEVRIPSQSAINVLQQLDETAIRSTIFAFPQQDWW